MLFCTSSGISSHEMFSEFLTMNFYIQYLSPKKTLRLYCLFQNDSSKTNHILITYNIKFYLVQRLKKCCYISGEVNTNFYSKGLQNLFNI